ncbi:MAG: alpha-glucosidase/alpha-galactosidase [Planctomycetota bacterium]|jgi:alpha-galactosidase|nr:alpha-glucosidase/alpha-galactosidase [Planctomycetota bacterium]
MSFKITFIGAGSIGFTRRLVRDLQTVPEFNGIEICLQDTSKRNLGMIQKLIAKDLKANGAKTTLSATTNQREALTGSKYIFNTARVGGLEAFGDDIDIPLRYGIDQCVGDTICAGGIMYGQRGVSMILDVCKDIREVAAPDAWLLNYANPMAMMTWAANTFGGVNCVGLCHGVQGGHGLIAKVLKLEKKDVDIICAGINHQTWYTRVLAKGKPVTTERLLKAMEADPGTAKSEKVRIDMLRRFGCFSTESNGHLSEYLPWYRKRSSEIKNWIGMDSWIHGETGGYLRVCTEGRNWFKTDFPNWLKGPAWTFDGSERSEEHGSFILEGLETGRVYRGHFNRINNGTIANLPDDCVIEAPGYVDRNGMSMPLVGDLPLGCAAVCQQSVNVQRLSVHAAVTGDIDLLRQAMLLDPLTGAVANPPEIWQMVDEMLVAQAKWLPQYRKAISQAKKRLAGKRIKTKATKGAARVKTKSVAEMQRNAVVARKNAQAADKGNMTSDKRKKSKAA